MGAKQNKENLEEIISSLADARLNDKKDLVVLGAKFEEFISGFNSQNLGQLQKLTNISWKGFKYLYSEVEYFMSIKSAMIQALNTIHEYLVNDDIEVKDFEKSYDDLSDVLKRGLSEVGEEDAETTEKRSADESVSRGETEKTPTETNKKSEEFFIPADIDIAMLAEFVAECTELLEMAEGALLDLEESPDDDELINKMFRAFHTIKGTSALIGLRDISEFTHQLETMWGMVRNGETAFDLACIDISLEAIDIISNVLELIETVEGGDHLPKPLNFDKLTTVLEKISSKGIAPDKALSDKGKVQYESRDLPHGQPQNGLSQETDSNEAPKDSQNDSQKEFSVRVNVNRLDQLIDMIGELIIAHSIVEQDKSVPTHSNLRKKITHTSKILQNLQDTSLSLRMVPLKATFQKMNRLVHDLSRKAGKSVKFVTYGGDTEIDRNIVNIINDPLVHIIRNALDHGIETPDERLENGKSKQANLLLKASHEGGKVVIEIEDDGRGINKAKVLGKAIDKGLVDADANLSEKEIYNLIFLPGFSSLDKVTNLSGRGVGMDVVRRSIEELKGKIDVESEEGKGTKIIIELPYTLAITDGMVVRVGTQRFIIPTLNIDHVFRVQTDEAFTVMGKTEKVSVRGETVPVIRLHERFDIISGNEMMTEGTLLAVRNVSEKYALLVDEVVEQQQLVGKSINIKAGSEYISGGAILGDGTVGLILDTNTLMKN